MEALVAFFAIQFNLLAFTGAFLNNMNFSFCLFSFLNLYKKQNYIYIKVFSENR